MPAESAAPTLPQRLRSPAVQLALLALWLLATMGWRPLLLPDEGRYANVAREMLRGDLAVPTLDGLPFFHKPPLLYWLDVAAMHVAGVTPLAARFAPALGAWIMAAALYAAMRRWHGARAAGIALLLCASCPLFFLSAQYVNHDMLVGGLIAAAVFAFVRAVDTAEPARVELRWVVAGWVGCALAMLAKGLIGFVLPALVIGPWLLARGRWRQLLRLLHPLGLLAFALVAAPWFVAMQARYPAFNDYFFMEQHFRRYALASFNNVHPFWFFIVVLPLATLPWSAWLPAALRRVGAEHRAMPGLYAWWVVAVVGFFSLPSSKLVGYVLPALAPWCALLALAVAGPRGADPRTEHGPLGRGARAALAIGVLVGLAAIADTVMERYFHAGFRAAHPESVAAFRATLLRGSAAGYAATCQAVRAVDWTDRLARIACPTLVIAGALDAGAPVAMSQAIAERIPGARLEVLAEASHLSVVEQPAAFAALLDGFLSGLS